MLPPTVGVDPLIPLMCLSLQLLLEQWFSTPAAKGIAWGIRLQCWRPGTIPGLGRSPGGGNGNPLQYSCLENLHGQRSPWGHKESDTTEWLSTWRGLILGDVQGSPLVIVITDYHTVLGGSARGRVQLCQAGAGKLPRCCSHHWEPPV